MMRATISFEPPGGKPTTSLIALAEWSCACAGASTKAVAASTSARATMAFQLLFAVFMVSSPVYVRSGERFGVEAHGDAAQRVRHGGVAVHHEGIMAGDDMAWRRCQLRELPVALDQLAHIEHEREAASAFEVLIIVARIGGEHDPAAPRVHAHRLHAHGVAADAVQAQTRCDLLVAVVEHNLVLVHEAHDPDDVIRLVGSGEAIMAHVAAGGEGHFV